MIGYLEGQVLFSDRLETIVQTSSGVGYQVYTSELFIEGQTISLFISHIIRETSQELFGFVSLRDKKIFELLLSVKGVGPKSAFNLVQSLGVEGVIQAVSYEDKKLLQKAPGVGAKAAAQIVLDLSNKIQRMAIYSNSYQSNFEQSERPAAHKEYKEVQLRKPESKVLDDALLACKELGFSEDDIIPIAQRILKETELVKSEQLIHLVLKEM